MNQRRHGHSILALNGRGLGLWKMGTEALFITAGALPFEWIERAGSYTAPLALYILREHRDRMASPAAASARHADLKAP